MQEQCSAYIDEAGARLTDGRRLYVVAAVVTAVSDEALITQMLGRLQLGGAPLHFRTERHDRRASVAKAIAELPLHGAILLSVSCGNTGQERARARLLCELLPRLEHVEGARRVILESRSGGDRHDLVTRDKLRRSHQITSHLRVEHAPKSAKMLWLPDWVASAYVAAHQHRDREPWIALDQAHLIEQIAIDPR